MSDTLNLHGQAYTNETPLPHTGKQIKKFSFIKILIFLLLFLLAAETLFYLFILPLTSVAHIHVSGLTTLSPEKLKEIAGLTGTEKWGRVNTATLSRRLANCPLIAQAKVTKKYPDKIFIEIMERTPVALLLAAAGNRTIPMEIDKTGTVFKVASDDTDRTLPIISGLSFQNPRAGMKVHKQLVPLFTQLEILQKKNPVLLSEISEIKIKQKKYGGFDLILYPVQTHIRVHIDNTLNEDRLRYMILMLDVVQKLDIESKIEELDVRAGTASYRLRGEANE